jgi:hypothetical protein
LEIGESTFDIKVVNIGLKLEPRGFKFGLHQEYQITRLHLPLQSRRPFKVTYQTLFAVYTSTREKSLPTIAVYHNLWTLTHLHIRVEDLIVNRLESSILSDHRPALVTFRAHRTFKQETEKLITSIPVKKSFAVLDLHFSLQVSPIALARVLSSEWQLRAA